MPAYLIDIVLLLFVAYAILITLISNGWKQLEQFNSRNSVSTPVSIIIAARNEERFISRCLASLLEQDYPHTLMEIIVVDDQSDDRTADIIRSFSNRGVKLLQLSDEMLGGKKTAISQGIAAAQYNTIITTDADCIYPEGWVRTMLDFQSTHDAVFVAAPVMFREENNFTERFQSLDLIALQSVTAVAVSKQWFNMCNGANLLYTKEAFEKVKGFEGIDNIPTGDDMLLMEKIASAYPGKVKYCLSKEAIVVTEPMQTWGMFLQQRIRWASKSTHYQSLSIKLVLLSVYLLNLSLLVLLCASVWFPLLGLMSLGMMLAKYVLELMLMKSAARFFEKKDLLRWFGISQPMHILYTVCAAMLGWVKRYEWKGRAVR